MLTQAAKRRAQADKAREGISEGGNNITARRTEQANESQDAMPMVIPAMGHWHSDKECPYHDESATARSLKMEKPEECSQ